MTPPTFEYYQKADRRWYWRLRAANNKIQADGAESFTSERGVKAAINRVIDGLSAMDYHIEKVKK